MKEKINQFLNRYMGTIILIFLFLQPFLDVFAGINQHILHWNIEINIIFRILFLLFAIVYLLFFNQTKYKKISYIYLFCTLIYFICYLLTIFFVKDSSVLFFEGKNFILTFYFPICLLFFWNVLNQYSIQFNLKYLIIILFIFILFIMIPNLFHLSFDSYTQGKVGNSGWFNSANSVSSIISILLPFFIIDLKNKKNLLSILFFIPLLYSIFSMGTKVPILSLLIIFIINFIYFVYNWIKKKEFKKLLLSTIVSIVIIVSMIFIIPKTSFYKNIKIHAEFLGIHSVVEIITNPHYIDRFIFSDRLTFLSHTKDAYIQSNFSEKIVGIGYIEHYSTDQVSTKMIEIDYFDILFRHGIIGFILYFLPIFIITYCSFKNIKNDFYHINILTSIILIYILALFSGHIFNVPSTSIFAAFILVFYGFKNNQITD